MSGFNINDYEIIPPHLSSATEMIASLWDKLGRPKDPLSKTGRKLVEFIFDCYKELFPYEYAQWVENLKLHKKEEWSITEQVRKHTGRSLLSYPYWVFMILKKVFPTFDFVKRENALKIAKIFPQFKIANKE